MDAYRIRFQWENTINSQDAADRPIMAGDLDDAKMEAAVLFALEPFKGPPPTGYLILDAAGVTLFRYPEGE